MIGEVHYRTFDGKRFDLTGSCSYKLLVSENVTIEMDQSVGVTHIVSLCFINKSRGENSLYYIYEYIEKNKLLMGYL